MQYIKLCAILMEKNIAKELLAPHAFNVKHIQSNPLIQERQV